MFFNQMNTNNKRICQMLDLTPKQVRHAAKFLGINLKENIQQPSELISMVGIFNCVKAGVVPHPPVVSSKRIAFVVYHLKQTGRLPSRRLLRRSIRNLEKEERLTER